MNTNYKDPNPNLIIRYTNKISKLKTAHYQPFVMKIPNTSIIII